MDNNKDSSSVKGAVVSAGVGAGGGRRCCYSSSRKRGCGAWGDRNPSGLAAVGSVVGGGMAAGVFLH